MGSGSNAVTREGLATKLMLPLEEESLLYAAGRHTSENRRRMNIYLSKVQGMLGSHFVSIHVKSALSETAGSDNSDRVWTTLVCAPVTDRLRDGRAGFRLVPSTGDLEHDLLSWPLASQIRIYMRSCGLVAGRRNKFSPTPPLN